MFVVLKVFRGCAVPMTDHVVIIFVNVFLGARLLTHMRARTMRTLLVVDVAIDLRKRFVIRSDSRWAIPSIHL